MINKCSTLIIVAHPDDEVLGCGGLIPRLAQEGQEVFIAILGEGLTARYAKPAQAEASHIKTLQAQSHLVAKTLQAKEVFHYGLPDNRFDSLPLLEIIKIIEKLIENIKPKVIYTHHAGDLNIDHRLANQAVLTATRPIRNHPVQEIYAFEVPSSTEWAFNQLSQSFNPNVFVDISDTLNLKLKALYYYQTETRVFPHPRSPEAITATARRWGSVVGCEAAEAFELIRSVRLRERQI
jgi:LmbE family N-acetylglucosaminyl deacetylase